MLELEVWQDREEDTLVSEVWDFEALRQVEIPAPSELRWIAVEEELDEEGNPTVIRETEVNSSDVGSDGSDDESGESDSDESESDDESTSESDSESEDESDEDSATGSESSIDPFYESE